MPYYLIPPSVNDDMTADLGASWTTTAARTSWSRAAQGAIVDRSKERLGESDKGVIIWRDLLKRQMKLVEDGGEPMNVFRDPAQNVRINVPPRDGNPFQWPGNDGGFMGRVNASWVHSPVVTELIEKYRGAEALERPVH